MTITMIDYAIVSTFTAVCCFGIGATAVVLMASLKRSRTNRQRRRHIGKLLAEYRERNAIQERHWRHRQEMIAKIIYVVSTGNEEQLEAHYRQIVGQNVECED